MTPAKKKAKSTPKPKTDAGAQPASKRIDQRIAELGDWRGETLARMRALILAAAPDAIEEWKWMGTPVWSHDGILCTGETYRQVVKLTFANGASLPDPAKLFNASLEGNMRRAIDIREGEKVDAAKFKALVKAAVARNKAARSEAKAKTRTKAKSTIEATRPSRSKVRLLSGDNPQIAMADGDAPVQAYIAAVQGWKQDIGRRIDALLVKAIPDVRKTVKWNSPMYGVEGRGYFLAFHMFKHYVKVTFFEGMSLRPLPPGTSTTPKARYLDIRQQDEFNEAQFVRWVKQAAKLPGFLAPR